MTRLDAAQLGVALAAGATAVAFTWQPGLASLYDDSVSYLLHAQALAPYGDAPAVVERAAALEKYPPLFGALLAATGAAFDWRLAHAVVAASFGASVWLLARYAARVTGSGALGFAAALVYALLPASWLNVRGILSEFPYMAITFAALALHASLAGHAPTRRVALALGALGAAAFLTRTIGMALVAALAAAELVRFARERDRARLEGVAWIAAIPVAAGALWYLLRPAGGEDAYATFSARLAGEAATGGWDYLAARLLSNAAALRDAWAGALLIFWGEPWRPGYLLAMALGLAGLAAALVRAARGEADGLYVAGFLAILAAWPFPGQMFRLALPVVPLLLVAFLWAWSALLVRVHPQTAARRAPLAAVLPLVLAVPATLFYIVPRGFSGIDAGSMRTSHIAEFYRIPSGAGAESNAAAQIAVLEDLRRIGETTPPDARVMWYWPPYVALLARREGVPLERPVDAADLARQIAATGADHLYLSELHPRDSARRDGHPLEPLPHALALGEPVWQRTAPAGNVRAVLVRLGPAGARDKRGP